MKELVNKWMSAREKECQELRYVRNIAAVGLAVGWRKLSGLEKSRVQWSEGSTTQYTTVHKSKKEYCCATE